MQYQLTLSIYSEISKEEQYDKLQESSTSGKDALDKSYELSDDQKISMNSGEIDNTSPTSRSGCLDSPNTGSGCGSGCFGAAEQGLRKLTGSMADTPVIKDHPHVVKLCAPLQILSAMFSAFAHGGNDVRWVIKARGLYFQQNHMWMCLPYLKNLTLSIPIFCPSSHPSVYHFW